MIFIERLRVIFVCHFVDRLTATFPLDAVAHIFIQPASRLFLRMQFPSSPRADVIMPDYAGILRPVFQL